MPNETAITITSPEPLALVQQAIERGMTGEQLNSLLDFAERYQANQARLAFHAAMAEFKKNPPRVQKNRLVKFGNTQYRHATLDHVCEQVIPALSKVGISHHWNVQQQNGTITVSCILTHEAGHSEATTISGPADTSGSKNPIQSVGSAVKYLQRYTLLAAVGLDAGEEDDDGHLSAGTSPEDLMPEDKLQEWADALMGASSVDELKSIYLDAQKAASKDPAALRKLAEVKNQAYRRITKGRA